METEIQNQRAFRKSLKMCAHNYFKFEESMATDVKRAFAYKIEHGAGIK